MVGPFLVSNIFFEFSLAYVCDLLGLDLFILSVHIFNLKENIHGQLYKYMVIWKVWLNVLESTT